MIENRETVDERIRALYKKHGTVTADIVIEDAKNPESPLHDQFEWDLEKAAMEAWRDTARRIIRSVKVVVTTESKIFKATGYTPPEFVRNPSAEAGKQAYVRAAEIKTDKDLARSALMYEIERINGCLTRARGLCDELGLSDEIVIVANAVRNMKNKASAA